jgi:hypothetical protein
MSCHSVRNFPAVVGVFSNNTCDSNSSTTRFRTYLFDIPAVVGVFSNNMCDSNSPTTRIRAYLIDIEDIIMNNI